MAIRNSVYAYPAIFTPGDEGKYSITFPDIECCYTAGDNLTHGIMMARDALSLMIFNNYEEKGIEVPVPSPINTINHEDGEFVTYIICDTLEYRKRFSTKAVKKTLTIPEWLNEAALEEKVNFSQVLQDALIERLKA